MRPEQTPVATAIGRRTLSLPLSAALGAEDADDVVSALVRSVG
jgi:dTDP-4-amino-4,6-dideoxygalactose transaminase